VHRQNKPQGHKALAAAEKNIRNVVAFLEGTGTSLFPARISANRGPYFQLVFHDGEAVTDGVLFGSPCGSFSDAKVRLRVVPGDIVLVEGFTLQKIREFRGLGKKYPPVDIVGHLSKRTAQMAFRSGKIHKAVYGKDEAEDGLFDYSEEDEEEEEESDGELETTRKRGKARAKKASGAAGRGSGGKNGLGDAARPTAHTTVRDALRDRAEADAIAARDLGGDGPDAEEMRILRALAAEETEEAPAEAGGSNAAGPGGPVPLPPRWVQSTHHGAALGAAPRPAVEASGFGLYEEAEEALVILRRGAVPENWEDEDEEDELDIDAI
jgi:hypothetical protein